MQEYIDVVNPFIAETKNKFLSDTGTFATPPSDDISIINFNENASVSERQDYFDNYYLTGWVVPGVSQYVFECTNNDYEKNFPAINLYEFFSAYPSKKLTIFLRNPDNYENHPILTAYHSPDEIVYGEDFIFEGINEGVSMGTDFQEINATFYTALKVEIFKTTTIGEPPAITDEKDSTPTYVIMLTTI